MQTAVQKSSSIRLWSVKMLLDNVNVGLLESSQLEVIYNLINLRAHNWYLPPRKKIESVKVTASLWELFFDNIAKIDSHGVFTNVASTPVTVTAEAHGTGWIVGQPFKLANKNGDNTSVASIVVKADGGALVLNTNYRVYVADGTNGENGYTYIVPVTTSSAVITADYSYTPNTKKRAVWSDVTKLISLYELKLINTDENGKTLTVTLPKWYSAGNMTWWFVADDAVDEVMKMPFEFQAYPDDSNQLLVIEDEQAPN